MHTSTPPRGVRDPNHALVVVAAEGLAVHEGERGDDEDDAGRSRELLARVRERAFPTE